MDTTNSRYPCKRFIREACLTQAEAGKICGLSQSTISRMCEQEVLSKADFNHMFAILNYIMKKRGDLGDGDK